MGKKLRVIIDMDDVMADTSSAILALYNKHFATNLIKSDFLGTAKWQEVQANYLSIRHQLFEPDFFRHLPLMPGAVETVKAIHHKHEVFIVSAAMEFPNSLKDKHDWLQEFFPFIHWKNMVLCGDKSIVKGDVMIDDHEKNLKTFIGRALLFDAVHNQEINEYKRVSSWAEIASILL